MSDEIKTECETKVKRAYTKRKLDANGKWIGGRPKGSKNKSTTENKEEYTGAQGHQE